MSDSTATPLPTPTPIPMIVPAPTAAPTSAAADTDAASEKRRSPSQLNQRQLRETEDFKLILAAALDPAHRPPLVLREITDPFLVQLGQDLEALGRCVTNAVSATNKKESATRAGADAAEALLNGLREAQAAARLKYFHSDPAKLKDFGIGERIDANRGTLDQTARTVVAKLTEERPPGVDTGFIERIEEDRQAFVAEIAQQSSAGGKGTTERELRDAAFASIKQRVQKIQFAADAAWPPHVPGNGGIRVRFLIPADRPFVG